MCSLPKFNQMGTDFQFDIQLHYPGLFYKNYMGTTQNKDSSTVNRCHISKKCIYTYLLITTKLLDQNPHGDPNPLYSLQNSGVHVDNFSQCMAIDKIKILGAVLELPAKQHFQSSPFTSKIGPNGLNWQCYLAGSSKTAPRILIFSIAMGAKP